MLHLSDSVLFLNTMLSKVEGQQFQVLNGSYWHKCEHVVKAQRVNEKFRSKASTAMRLSASDLMALLVKYLFS